MPELYSEQDAETKVIVPALEELGYSEAIQDRDVVLRFRHPISVSQGREARTIFADIVVFVDGTPVIVVDSKNPRQFLSDNDREQVISYARLIGDVAPYSVLCNGHTWRIFDTITKQQITQLPAYDTLLEDIQMRRLSPNQRTSLQSQAARTLFAIDSARDLSRIMRRCHDIIRNIKGYDPTKAFDELSKLLFAKMYEEREVDEGNRTTNRFTLDTVREMRREGVEIIQTLWQNTVSSERYRDVFSDQSASQEIELPPEAIDEIVAILEDKSLGRTDLDVKGVAFEEFLASTYRGGGLGQYFTPRDIVNFMVDLVSPAIGERVVDPACGTGGFLIRVFDVVSQKNRTADISRADRDAKLHELANTCLAGIDWETRAARTCKMNMIIHGDGHAGVYQANSLDLEEVREKITERRSHTTSAPAIDDEKFDIVLTNPPFGATDRSDHILAPFELGRRASQKREVLLLERCVQLLKPGGRLAVVLPEGILSNKTDAHIRRYIREKCIVKAIIRLPQDAFKMSQGAACTSILYAVKRDPSDSDTSVQRDIFFARAEEIGISPSGRPIARNDLLSIKEHFRRFEAGDWDGIELRSIDEDQMEVVRLEPSEDDLGLWIEPEVNRTSLLYDCLSYIVRCPRIQDRFSYTYFHPWYWQISASLKDLSCSVVKLEDLCQEGFPRRGKKPNEDAAEGIPVLKVRNVTGMGIDLETDFAPDTDDIRAQCDNAIVRRGDILLTSTGEGTIGRVDIYPYDDTAIVDGHVSIVRPSEGVNVKYLIEYLRSEHGQVQLLRHVSGSTGQTELLIDHVKSILVPIPSQEVQQSIVELMDTSRAESERLNEQSNVMRTLAAQELAEARQVMIDTLSGAA